ncbi:MAG: right-handed parallel beta-helix repeat-containing protein, partial [Actinobacteria bacterium]|nr:right-handed parallel beta-helix repeat-containing protein [Actinomycetota bacterium]
MFRSAMAGKRVPLGFVGIFGLIVAGLSLAAAPPASAQSCQTAGGTGLTATMIATTGENIIDQTINAAGCDVGIYVPPGSSGVTISDSTVEHANDHGIFVQDSSDITIENDTVTDNGLAPDTSINENKAIQLVGTSGSTISGNTVTGNYADGGIGIADDGPNVDPGAPDPSAKAPVPSDGNTVSGNTVSDNYSGCGIVLAAYNPGAGIGNSTVSDNKVIGSPGKFGPHGPVIGSVVVAADDPATSVSNITVTGNTIVGGFIPLVVHSNAPKDTVSNVSITDNTITANDWGAVDGPPVPAAIIVAATQIPPPVTPTITSTTITGNTISHDFYGVWIAGAATATTTSPNSFSLTPGGRDVFSVPPPGSGYWLVGTNGSIYTFGDATYFGSLGGYKVGSPQVPAPI